MITPELGEQIAGEKAANHDAAARLEDAEDSE